MYLHHVQKYLEQEQQQRSFAASGGGRGRQSLAWEPATTVHTVVNSSVFLLRTEVFKPRTLPESTGDAKEFKHLGHLMNEFL